MSLPSGQFAQPGQYNTFVPTMPNGDANDAIIVGFSRDLKSFAVNSYSTLVPVGVSAGKYLALNTAQFIRFPYAGGQANQWPDGADRPTGEWNTVPFSFQNYVTQRKDYPFILGQKAVEQAQFAIQQVHIDEVGVQAMTDRTQAAIGSLIAVGTGANWGPNEANVDGTYGALNGNAALLAAGQNWSNGTPSSPNIKKCLQTAAYSILKATQSVVQQNQLKLVVGPGDAYTMSQSPEIQVAFIQSQFAAEQTTGMGAIAANFGLPPSLYGIEILVEQSFVDTSNLNAAALSGSGDSVSPIVPTGGAWLVARPGALVGVEGGRNWSTLVGFFYEELTMEVFQDPINRRVQGHATSDYSYVTTSSAVGYHFSHVNG